MKLGHDHCDLCLRAFSFECSLLHGRQLSALAVPLARVLCRCCVHPRTSFKPHTLLASFLFPFALHCPWIGRSESNFYSPSFPLFLSAKFSRRYLVIVFFVFFLGGVGWGGGWIAHTSTSDGEGKGEDTTRQTLVIGSRLILAQKYGEREREREREGGGGDY